MRIQLVITGRAYHAAEHFPDAIELPEGATVDDALEQVNQLTGDQPLPASCLVAVSGRHLGTLGHHQNRPLADGDELALIAPVAGG